VIVDVNSVQTQDHEWGWLLYLYITELWEDDVNWILHFLTSSTLYFCWYFLIGIINECHMYMFACYTRFWTVESMWVCCCLVLLSVFIFISSCIVVRSFLLSFFCSPKIACLFSVRDFELAVLSNMLVDASDWLRDAKCVTCCVECLPLWAWMWTSYHHLMSFWIHSMFIFCMAGHILYTLRLNENYCNVYSVSFMPAWEILC